MSIKVRILDHGSMHCDLAWLVLKGGLTLAGRADHALPRQWGETPTFPVLIERPDGRLLSDTSCPDDWEPRSAIAGNQEYFAYDGASEEQHFMNTLGGLRLGL